MPRLSRDETLARLLEPIGDAATVYDPNDWKAPYASGSAKVDAYVICPCSMGTLGTIASGAMQNLIHRAASVALKEERRLILMPRETPLSTIHLRNMLTLREAGATILFLAPGFYHGAETVADLVDFIVARTLDQLGLDNALAKRWGQSTVETGTLPAEGVQRMFDRIAPVYDVMNRVMTGGLDRRWRRITVEQAVSPGDRVLDALLRHGRSRDRRAAHGAAEVVGLDFCEEMLERARRKAPELEWVRGDALALPFEDASFDAATVGFGVRNVDDLEAGLRELRRVLRPGGRLAILEITTPVGALAPFYGFWFDRVDPAAREGAAGRRGVHLPAGERSPVPGTGGFGRPARGERLREVRFRRFAGGIVAFTWGERVIDL